MEIDYNYEINNFENEIFNNEIPSDVILLKQTFVVWYSLVEGNTKLDEVWLQDILNRNTNLIRKHYPRDPNLLFLRGWMIEISSWLFDSEDSNFGSKYLISAYKYCPNNLLFKWALRGSINLSKDELNIIKISIQNRFEDYYVDYRPIREYYQDMIKDS
ncbi:hypothetical protein [Flavobacterium cerinum]|uniref:Uncharacterized protein n=1 Tax=Flavobacterium cerinum TaxID=2502784 RepID=A0A3S4SWI8_9FLAO|nr:hypothetical protein [Flavobacterium cerinum]RWW96707.1 hypothetical protein EPI11_14025 [Flavobacterium cerinum]